MSACTVEVSLDDDHEDEDGHASSVGFISSEDLSEDIGHYSVIDVRSQQEYEVKHLAQSTNIPLFELSLEKLSERNISKESNIVVYGLSSIQGKKAQTLLEAMEFHDVLVLDGGIAHWEEDGFATKEGSDPTYKNEQKETISSLAITPKEIDLGLIKRENGIVEVIFTVKNTGDETVSIEEISTSCGCTSAEIENEDIEIGSSAQLTVFFDPNFHQEPMGRFTRSVFLFTSEGIELQSKIWVEIEEN